MASYANAKLTLFKATSYKLAATGEVVGDHANHPSYDRDISDRIDEIFNESNGNMSDAYDDFFGFVNDLKTELNSQVVEGDKIVNTLIVP